jgi:glycosyltransferase involved in cell wall biosynthesis
MLEAFKNGCPIACSDTSCLPEVGGTAVSYFDPGNASSMIDTISKLITDDQLRYQHIQDGYEQIRQFTFEKCISQTLDCYQSLINKS